MIRIFDVLAGWLLFVIAVPLFLLALAVFWLRGRMDWRNWR